MPPQRIIPRTQRRLVATLAVSCAIVLVALGVALHDHRDTTFDHWVFIRLDRHLGDHARVLLLGLSEPGITIGVLAMVTVGALIARSWPVAVLAVAGPLLAIGLTEEILKPLIHRTQSWTLDGMHYHGLAFPSGHETGLVAMLTVVGLLLPRVRLSPLARTVAYAVLIGWALLGAIGLVRGFYHFATDTIGGIAVAIAVVCGVAFVVDAVAARTAGSVSSPAARVPARTSRAA
jgi:undecaprenyl-diphosphatase